MNFRSNGPNEAINGLIQAAKARARGFRTLENLIAIAVSGRGQARSSVALATEDDRLRGS